MHLEIGLARRTTLEGCLVLTPLAAPLGPVQHLRHHVHHCGRAAVDVYGDVNMPRCRVKPAIGYDVPASAHPKQRH